jgi:hypothetical protein
VNILLLEEEDEVTALIFSVSATVGNAHSREWPTLPSVRCKTDRFDFDRQKPFAVMELLGGKGLQGQSLGGITSKRAWPQKRAGASNRRWNSDRRARPYPTTRNSRGVVNRMGLFPWTFRTVHDQQPRPALRNP